VDFGGKVSFENTEFKMFSDFHETNFLSSANFRRAEFRDKTYFSGRFERDAKFDYVVFGQREKVIFDVIDLSHVSFINTDLSLIRFSDKSVWGGGDRFQITEDRELVNYLDDNSGEKDASVSLGGVMSVYRRLINSLLEKWN
jgi:hypothetical protein